MACYAKLLTGGTLPLAVTLATQDVFEVGRRRGLRPPRPHVPLSKGGVWQAFRGDTKSHALLHGHSYTAHPIGCSVAIASLDAYLDPALNPNLGAPRRSLGRLAACTCSAALAHSA